MHFSERLDINYRHALLKARSFGYRLAPCGTRTAVLSILILLLITPRPGISATTGRFWSYLNLAAPLNPNWAFIMMPGVRYEFARSDPNPANSAREFYFYELLVGPTYTKTWGNFTVKLPVWYYYMGFPTPGDYAYAHNIEFLPIAGFRSGKVSFTSRTIFHNTVYASVYDTPEQRSGYSLVIRQLLELSYDLHQKITLLVADEPFFGIIKDQEAPPSAIGFWPSGFRLNRFYAGFRYKLTPRFVISPEYVLETVYDEGDLTDTNHYLFVTFSYILKIF